MAFALNKRPPPRPQLETLLWLVDQCREVSDQTGGLGVRCTAIVEQMDRFAATWGDAAGGCSWRDLV